VFATLLALIVILPIPYGSVQAWWIALFEFVVFITTILWISGEVFSGSWFVKEHRVLIPLVAVALLAFVQIVPLSLSSAGIGGVEVARTISADPFETKQFAVNLLAHTLLLAMLIRFTDSEARLRKLTYVVIAIGVASAVFGLVRFAAQSGEGGFVLHYLKPQVGFGFFINGNHFAFLLEMAFGLIAGLAIFGGIAKRGTRLFLAFAITIWVATSLSNSRGGIFALVCQMILSWLLLVSMKRTGTDRSRFEKVLQVVSSSSALRAATLAAMLVVVVVGTLWVGGDKLTEGVSNVSRDFSADSEKVRVRRGDIWKASWRLFEAYPITGCGFGGFSAAITKYHEGAGNFELRQAHNDYLEILASGGLIGAVLGIWFFFGVCNTLAARIQSDAGFTLAARWGAIIALFGVAIHSLVEFGLHIVGNSAVFIALLAISLVNVRPQGDGGQPGTEVVD
jgi:putative inorganic carbon (HCO3(-)) transporter